MAVVFSLEKPIILMDEPTSSLDDKSISNLVKIILSLKNNTVLAASHNQQWLDLSEIVVDL